MTGLFLPLVNEKTEIDRGDFKKDYLVKIKDAWHVVHLDRCDTLGLHFTTHEWPGTTVLFNEVVALFDLPKAGE